MTSSVKSNIITDMHCVSFRRRLALLSAVIMFVLSVGGGGDMVLCVTPDGRLAVEEADGPCCDASLEREHASPAASGDREADGHHCDECIDIPLSGINNCVAPGHNPGLSKSLSVIKASFRALPVHPTADASFSDTYHHKTRLHASVRMVNLRI